MATATGLEDTLYKPINNLIIKVIILALLHAALSLAAYAGLSAWAIGFLDSGAEPGAAFAAAQIVMAYVLLQPAAYWILTGADVAWWTWPGLALTAGVVLGNSLIQIGLAVALWQRLPRGSAAR